MLGTFKWWCSIVKGLKRSSITTSYIIEKYAEVYRLSSFVKHCRYNHDLIISLLFCKLLLNCYLILHYTSTGYCEFCLNSNDIIDRQSNFKFVECSHFKYVKRAASYLAPNNPQTDIDLFSLDLMLNNTTKWPKEINGIICTLFLIWKNKVSRYTINLQHTCNYPPVLVPH